MNRPIRIVVPVFRNAGLTRACVDSILTHRHEIAAHGAHLHLINDSPDDSEVTALLDGYGAMHADVTITHNERNRGFVKSANTGLREAIAAGADALLINSDTLTFAGTMATLLGTAATRNDIGFANPRSNSAAWCSLPASPASTQLSPDDARVAWATLSQTLPSHHVVPTAVGFYLYVSYAVLANVGLFDEEFGLGYEEENDLVMRARRMGYRAILVNQAFAFHHGSASFSLIGPDLSTQRSDNLRRVHARHPDFEKLLRRYDESAHRRVEHLLSGLLPDSSGQRGIVFDLTGLARPSAAWFGRQVIQVLRALNGRNRHRCHVICTERWAHEHGLDQCPGLTRLDPGAGGLHAVAVRFGLPREEEDLRRLRDLAPVNACVVDASSMVDVDWCSDVSLRALDLAASCCDALLFTNATTRSRFEERQSPGPDVVCVTTPMPWRAQRLVVNEPGPSAPWVVWAVGADPELLDLFAVRLLSALQDPSIVVLGTSDGADGRLTHLDVRKRSERTVDEILANARGVIVADDVDVPDEGLRRALRVRLSVLARDTDANLEFAARFELASRIGWFQSNDELVALCNNSDALPAAAQHMPASIDPDGWCDDFEALCDRLLEGDRTYARALSRFVLLGDFDARHSPLANTDARTSTGATLPPLLENPASLDALLALDGRDFIRAAYATLLLRPADPGGIAFYEAQLHDGVAKLDVVRSLSISPEGRARGVKIDGLAERLAARKRPLRRLLRHLFKS